MAPLTHIDPLGKKHKKINYLVQETLEKSTPFEDVLKECGNTDVDNLVKIKIACKLRNIQYILEILKSQDMLYISCALKHSAWLVNDGKYSNVITPQYLYNELFPFMNRKAICKLLLFIRLNLKDESRVEEFYKYYEDNNDIRTAVKWLPNCSVPTIERAVEKHYNEINVSLFKRLCERSFTIFEVFVKKQNYRQSYMNAVKFFINTHCQEYVKVLDKVEKYVIPSFDQKHTKLLLQECPEVIGSKFERFADNLHKKTVAKFLGPDKIKDFLLRHSENENLHSWYRFENIKPFITQLNQNERFPFVKALFIDKLCETGSGDPVLYKKYLPILKAYHTTVYGAPKVYQWYKFTSFSTAFPDLIKIIKSESSSEERIAILKVLITCAQYESHSIHKLLEYFCDKHINEPFRLKIEFVNNLLTMVKTYRFKEESWKLLDEVFYNLEVYFESEKDVNKCLKAIVMYRILHKQPVPEVIEKKIKQSTFNFVNLKIDENEKELIFKYLYSVIENKLITGTLDDESSFERSVSLIIELLTLLKQMHKDLIMYPSLLERIKKVVEIKQIKGWNTDIESIFKVNNSWRKLMFEESLTLGHKVDACLNALKHDPTLLTRHLIEVQKLQRNDKIMLDRVIAKIRVYWPETLASDWTTAYRTELKRPPPSRAVVRGLCLLLPPSELQLLLEEYAPTTAKIQWSEVDEISFGIQKYLGQNMYIARPNPRPQLVLQYATGDYLPFTLPSLISVFYNLNVNDSRNVLKESLLISTSVSLQKHGMRFAFSKLKSDELKEIFSKIWSSSKNMTIRAIVFELTYKLLCKEKNTQRVDEIWQLLEIFIEKLSPDEDRKIYSLMEKVDQVPLTVRAKFCVKSYKILKSFPSKANCEEFVNVLAHSTRFLMDTIDPTFVVDITLDHLKNFYIEKDFENYYKNNNFLDIIAAFTLHCKDVDTQMQRYEQIILPIINYSKDTWNAKHRQEYIVRNYFKDLIQTLAKSKVFIENGYIVPIKMFNKLKNDFEIHFSLIENYYILTYLRINLCFLEAYCKAEPDIILLSKEKKPDDDTAVVREHMWNLFIPDFISGCLQLLKEDTSKYFSTIHVFFGKILKSFIQSAMFGDEVGIVVARGFLSLSREVPSFLLALKLLPNYAYDSNKTMLAECCKDILAHPSPEVKMHYYRKFGNTDNT